MKYPELAIIVGLIILGIHIFIAFKKRKPKYYVSNPLISFLQKTKSRNKFLFSLLVSVKKLLIVLIYIILVILIARPGHYQQFFDEKKGLDVVILLDGSGSMDIEDVVPSRLEAAKTVVKEYLETDTVNRIGLVAFAGSTSTLCPLTFDHKIVASMLDRIDYSLFVFRKDEMGTAVGEGIISATDKFVDDASNRPKAIIMITDAESNSGIDPLEAAKYASSKNVKVYSILINNDTYSNSTQLLDQISKTTDGKYYIASDKNKLKEIFNQIDALEKSKLDAGGYVAFIDTPDSYYICLIIFITLLFVIKLKVG